MAGTAYVATSMVSMTMGFSGSTVTAALPYTDNRIVLTLLEVEPPFLI